MRTCYAGRSKPVLVSCPSGRRSTPGKCVCRKASRVRISCSPPLSFKYDKKTASYKRFFCACKIVFCCLLIKELMRLIKYHRAACLISRSDGHFCFQYDLLIGLANNGLIKSKFKFGYLFGSGSDCKSIATS